MSWDTVSLDWKDSVATLTIDRPKALNAINVDTLEAMDEAINEARTNDARALVLTGAGEKAFIAGADIKYMKDHSVEEAQEWSEEGHSVAKALHTFPAPTIAAINGYAFGGGCEMLLACDIRVASENAIIGQPEIDLGAIPGWGGTQRLPRIVGDETARRMIFLGERLPAAEAKERGLVGEVVPLEDLSKHAAELASELAEKPYFALQAAKQAINQTENSSLEAGLDFEKRTWAGLFGTDDQREGMEAYVEDREPEFE